MNKAKVNFFGREFELKVVYDCYEGEEILSYQKEALQNFIENQYNLDNDLEKLKNYCLNLNKEEIGEEIDNIFRYVIPVDIYVVREKETIAIMCKYKYDLEHGLALVYKNKKLKEIGTQDIVL